MCKFRLKHGCCVNMWQILVKWMDDLGKAAHLYLSFLVLMAPSDPDLYVLFCLLASY